MEKLLLEATEINVDIHPNAEYRNQGVWNYKKLKKFIRKRDPNMSYDATGLCYLTEESSGIFKDTVKTVILSNRSFGESLTLLGHEETHAIQILGQLDKFPELYNTILQPSIQHLFS